jgi:hypothetical protein
VLYFVRVFAGRRFGKWAEREGLDDARLFETAMEAFAGDYDADLGGYLFKKRLAREGEGKSGGYRTILCFRKSDQQRIFFLHGFAKGVKGNITDREATALKLIARSLMDLTEGELRDLVLLGAYVEVKGVNDGSKQ